MTKSDIKHILDPVESAPAPKEEPKLVFTHTLYEEEPALAKRSISQPENWDNVRHLTANVYYAWDDEDPEDGRVYLGEFR